VKVKPDNQAVLFTKIPFLQTHDAESKHWAFRSNGKAFEIADALEEGHPDESNDPPEPVTVGAETADPNNELAWKIGDDEKVNDNAFVPIEVVVEPGEEKMLDFGDCPDFICQFNFANRSDPKVTGKVELHAALKCPNSDNGEIITQQSKWVEFAEGDVATQRIDFVVDLESELKLTVVGDGGITLTGEKVLYLDYDEEKEEEEAWGRAE
jgi:hypothetical protein